MPNAALEAQVRQVLANTPGCCRENALMALADSLRTQGREAEAKELASIVGKLLEHKPQRRKRSAGPTSRYIQGAPVSADRYYESCTKKYKDRADVAEHCADVALKIVCGHVDTRHSICGKLRK